MSASKKSARTRRPKSPGKFKGKPPRWGASDKLPALDSICDALADAEAFVNVVYTAFQINGRDGPEQPVLWHAIQTLERVHEQLDAACSQIERLRRKYTRATGGAS